MDMQSKRGKALSVVTAATLAASLGVPAVAIAEEVDQAAAAQETAYQRGNVVDEMLAVQDETVAEDSTGKTAVDTRCVATIGTVEYASLNEAFEKAVDGDTIKLASDADISQSESSACVNAGIGVVLDLSGYQLKAANTKTGNIVVHGSLTITDSTDAKKDGSGKGRIYTETEYASADTGYGVVSAESGGVVVMESGKIDTASFTADNANRGQFAVTLGNKTADSSFIMNGGKIEAGWYAVSGNGNNKTYDGNITVNGGTLVSRADYAIYNPQKGTVSINGGVVYGQAGGIALNAGNLVMTGGIVTSKGQGDTGSWGDGTGGLKNAAINVNAKYGDVSAKISGGDIIAEGDALVIASGGSNKASVLVSGGKFSSSIREDFCAPGYKPVQNSDGKWTVEVPEESRVAEIAGVYYPSIADAFVAARNGETVALLKDSECNERLVVKGKSVALDLAGHTVTTDVSSNFITLDDPAATLAIKDSGVDGKIVATKADPVVLVKAGTFDFQDGTIAPLGTWMSGDKPYGADAICVFGSTLPTAEAYSNVIVGKDATISYPNDGTVGFGYGVDINYDKALKEPHAFGVTVKMDGTTVNGGMYLNGSIVDTEGNVPVVNVGSTAKIDGMIYAAGYAKWNIDGAEIKGDTGMEIRAGVLNVTGGSIEGTSTPTGVKPNGNGSTTDGAGIAIAQHTTKLPIEVNVSGGTVAGHTAFYQSNPQNNPEDATAKVKLNITGGSFSASNGGVNAVYSENCTGFITGGTFSSKPADEFVAEGYKASESNGKWTVSEIVPPAPPAPAPQPEPQPETDVEQRPDGSTVTTVTQPDGSQTVTTESADGTESVVSKDAEGNVTSTEVTVSDEAAQAGEVVLPLEPSKPAADSEKAPAVEVKVPASVTAEAPVKVTVPVEAAEEPNYGVVVYAVDADGNEVLLPKCGVDAEGNAVFEAAGDVTVKVVDASPSFPDTAGEWYGEDGTADFVGARGILTGVPQADGTLAFAGDEPTTRAMFVTMLHRAESKPSAPEAGFEDMDGSEWYAAAAAWGEAAGVVNGYGDGSEFGGDDPVTREQMAVFAMRYAKHLGLDVSGRADLSAFPDGGQASDWASEALSWAVSEGLLRGHADGTGRLDPKGGATRAETAAVVMRFINGLYV